MNFLNRHNYNDLYDASLLSIEGNLSVEDTERLKRHRRNWNFYDGFHWEEIPEQDKPEITENYCRTFVNKFVSFEFGKGFNIKTSKAMEGIKVVDDKTLFDFLTDVWKDNSQMIFCTELGQMKSITGDGWVQIMYYKPEELDDPFGEYPHGRIKVFVIPSSVTFPLYDRYDKSKLVELLIQYPIRVKEETPILRRVSLKTVIYKQRWTKDRIEIWEGNDKVTDIPNKYGAIPFAQIKNFPVAGRSEGISDLEDVIPLNVELNMKKSDVSETIDYHSSPVTIVFGAKVSSLEKGANKLWGGLPKDAKVENLQLNGDLTASVSYIHDLKVAMSEIGSVPEHSLGGAQAISNTSGVALQYANLPLIDRTKIKRVCTQEGLQLVNKLILLVAVKEGLIKIPEGVLPKDFYSNEVTLPDTLPKDVLMELQSIQQEMKSGLEDRRGAMLRLDKENIEEKLKAIEKDSEEFPLFYGIQPSPSASIPNAELDINGKPIVRGSVQQGGTPNSQSKVNSGMTNGQTPVEQVRNELTGKNGGKPTFGI